jgi:hypothetical protein
VTSENEWSGKLYQLLLTLHSNGSNKFKCINYVKSILDDTGFSNIWNSKNNINITFLKTTVKQRLQVQFIQKWFSDIDNASRGEFYSHLKKEFILEPYLLRLKRGFRTVICKLRTCNIKFPIETGRWQRVPKNERICKLYRTGFGGRILLYMFLCNCDKVKFLMQKYIPRYYLEYPHVSKLHQMLKNGNTRVLTYLSIFIKKVEPLLK